MTTIAQIPQSVSPTMAAARPVPLRAVGDRVAFPLTVGALFVMYLLVHNQYWVPGGDSEVYTAIARNLALGKGYLFNGQPVSMVPPGWSMTLAGMMLISPTFGLLKMVTLVCMVGSLAISYWICRRFASPALSALVIVLTGILSHVYSLTFWLHSDSLFCLVSAGAMLIAFQMSEGRNTRSRGGLLLMLCAMAVFVRWAGLLTWLLVAAILLRDELMPRYNPRWTRAFATGALSLLTFIIIRYLLTVSPEVQRKSIDFGGSGEEAPIAAVERADANVATTYQIFNPAKGGIGGLIARAYGWGNWVSYLLWQPMRLGRANPALGFASLLSGWIVLVPLLMVAGRGMLTRQWLWPAIMLYSFALVLNWPAPNARYLVPIAPLLILGVFKGLEQLREYMVRPQYVRATRVLAGYFVASLLLCNGALWAADLYVARSNDFYGKYEAGLNSDLITVTQWLNEQKPADGEVSICWRYYNLNRRRYSPTGLRMTNLLTDVAIVRVPDRYDTYNRGTNPRRNTATLAWANGLKIKYLIFQTDVSPWRVFHFRAGLLQELMTGQPAVDAGGAGWQVFKIPPPMHVSVDPVAKLVRWKLLQVPPMLDRVSLNPTKEWPTRVAGM